MILILSLLSSFEISKVNPFHAFTAPSLLICLSNLFIAFEAKLLSNAGKLSLTKEKAIFVEGIAIFFS